MARSLEEIEWEALSAAAPDEYTNPQVDTPLMSPPPCGNSAGGSVSGTSPALFDTMTLVNTINSLFGRHFQRDPIDDDYDNRGEREYRLWRER